MEKFWIDDVRKKKIIESIFARMHIKLIWEDNKIIEYPMGKDNKTNTYELFLGIWLSSYVAKRPENEHDKECKWRAMSKRRTMVSKHIATGKKQAKEIINVG